METTEGYIMETPEEGATETEEHGSKTQDKGNYNTDANGPNKPTVKGHHTKEFKTKQASKTLPVMEEPASKRQKVIADNQPIVMMICNEVVVIIKDNTQKKSPARKEAATEAKVRAAQESTMVPLKIRMLQLRRMFKEKQVSASFSWKK